MATSGTPSRKPAAKTADGKKTGARRAPAKKPVEKEKVRPSAPLPAGNDGMLNMAIKAARLAGKIQMNAVEQGLRLEITSKSAGDFVTQVDKECETAIIEMLSKAYPDHAFQGEEMGKVGPEEAEYTWIIDPLDGTTNFIRGIPQFAVSIACVKGGKVQHAVVFDPSKNELFTASRGKGATLDNKRIRVTKTYIMKEALIGTGFPFRQDDNYEGYLRVMRPLMEQTAGMRRPGSAALDLCWVACGRYDAFWESGLKSWDLAAGALIAQEAGALVTDFDGEDKYLEQGNIVAGTPKIFVPLLNIIKTNWNKKAE